MAFWPFYQHLLSKTYLYLLMELIVKNPNFSDIWTLSVEASWCYFFETWMMKLKYRNLLKALSTIFSRIINFSAFQSQFILLSSMWDTRYYPLLIIMSHSEKWVKKYSSRGLTWRVYNISIIQRLSTMLNLKVC